MEDFKIKVPGIDFTLVSNRVYHIREVSDPSAPDGYQRKGISKHPLPGMEDSIVVPYSENTSTWNTGFFSGSECIVRDKAGSQILEAVEKHLLPELQILMEVDLTIGKSSNNKHFDDFIPFSGTGYGEDTSKYKIKGGNMFNTSNPLEYLALWWALIGRQVMPPKQEGRPAYKNCFFTIEDKQQTASVEENKEFDKTLALTTVMTAVSKKNKRDINHLQNIFTYVGLTISVGETATRSIISTFSRWSTQGGFNNENAAEFNSVFERFSKKENQEELIAYIKLLGDIKTSKILVERRDIILEGVNLGPDKKAAARKIVADQELHKAFLLL